MTFILLFPSRYIFGEWCDWVMFQQAFEQKTSVQRLSLVKLIHAWLNTGQLDSYIFHENSPICPNCDEIETMSHVFQCCSSSRQVEKVQTIEKFYIRLRDAKTHPLVILFLRNTFIRWLLAQDVIIPWEEIPSSLKPIMEQTYIDQRTIGFDQMIYGRIVQTWRQLYVTTNEYFQNTISSKQSSKWAVGFIHNLWDLGFDLWQIRNNSLHKNSANEPSKMRQWLQERVEIAYAQNAIGSSPENSHLFHLDKDKQKQASNNAIIKWLQSVSMSHQHAHDHLQNPHRYQYTHCPKITRDQLSAATLEMKQSMLTEISSNTQEDSIGY